MRNPFAKPKRQQLAHVRVAHLVNTPWVYLSMADPKGRVLQQLLYTPEQAEEIARDFDRVAALARQFREANNA